MRGRRERFLKSFPPPPRKTSTMHTKSTGEVWFIGAGPGAPDLITLRGHKLIGEADLVLYAGSLVPREVVAHAKPGAVLRDSAPMTLEETHALIAEFAARGQNTARVHTGDPTLYGALLEQTRLLDQDGIPWRVIPGVSAAFATAAAAGQSLTLPEIRQSVIITRLAGKTPMPPGEDLRALAASGAALALYLSATLTEELQAELLSAGLAPETKIIVGRRVTWPDEQIFTTRLDQLVKLAQENNFTGQTLFLVLPGESFDPQSATASDPGTSSRLYAGSFNHAFRRTKQD